MHYQIRGELACFPVWVKPRASRSRLTGEREGALEVAVAAPPVDGEANDALTRFVARLLDLPPRDVRVVRGESSRRKELSIPLTAALRLEELWASLKVERKDSGAVAK